MKEFTIKAEPLLRCPFCGGEAEILEHDNGWAIWHCIMCKNCKASQEWRKGYTKEEAIKAWNTRKPMERILEKLNERIEHHVKLVNYEMNMGTIVDVERHEEAIKATDKAIEIVKEEGGIE